MTLLAGAVFVFIDSTRLVDVPGPITPDKPEFSLQFIKLLLVLSAILALAGGALLAGKFKSKA